MKRFWFMVGAVALIIALAVRIGFVGVFAESPLYEPLPGAHDRTIYHEAARAVADGNVWPDGSFEHMPLYPWVLGAIYRLFGDRLVMAAWLGLVCEALTVLFLLLLARRLGAHPLAALFAAVLYALYPLAIVYAPLTMPNTLNVMLVTAFALVLYGTPLQGRPARCVGAGLLGGVTALGFAGTLLIACGFLVWRGIRETQRRRVPWQGAVLFIVGFALPLMPVSIHNTRAEGAFVLLTTHGGFNFYMGNHEQATGYPVRVRDFRMTARAMLEDAHRAAEEETGRSMSRAESSAWWMEQGRRFWKEQPVIAAGLTLKKAALFWSFRDIDDLRMREQLQLIDRVFVSPLWPGFAWFGVLGLVGLLFARGAVPKVVLLSGMISLVLFFITARYRLTLVPLMAALGAGGLTALVPPVRWRLLRAVWLLPGIVMVAWPFEVRDLRPVDHYNASVQVIGAGDAERALVLAQDGLRIDQYNADLYHAQGHALAELDRYEEAVRSFRNTVALNPAHASGRYNLALSLARLERVCEAADVLEEWIAIAPHDSRAVGLHADLRRLCREGVGR